MEDKNFFHQGSDFMERIIYGIDKETIDKFLKAYKAKTVENEEPFDHSEIEVVHSSININHALQHPVNDPVNASFPVSNSIFLFICIIFLGVRSFFGCKVILSF